MRRLCLVSVTCLLATIVAMLSVRALADESAKVKKLFVEPTRDYTSAPLWVWNDMLTDEQIVGTLRDLAAQKVKQAFVHPRPGLMTPYLSPEWFRLWKLALGEAERLDMNLWIYDENSYPSGFAGGWVPEMMPEARGRGLVFREETQPGKPGDDVLGVFRLQDEKCENVTAQARDGKPLPQGKYVVASMVRAKNSPWHGNRCYVDLMYPGVTEKFLDVTLEAYRREIGDQFGKRVPGAFTDEPQIRPAGGLPWTDHLPAAFQRRWGYNLLDHLPSLTQPVGDWRRIRHNYFQLISEQFIERWAKPYYEYCRKHQLEFTGHYWDHEWPKCAAVPDNMAMAAWQQRPGIDCLMNQYRENTHAQFGNVRMVKELSSVANQLGRKRTLCELYGAGGWDLRFEDMKRIGDWLQVLGVNTFDEHLSYVTLRGARKADHPQSFSYHEPWWNSYHVVAEYFARLSAAMSHGKPVNRVLVLEPTTTAWMYQGDDERLTPLGDSFFTLLLALEKAQAEYDIGCEEILAGHGSVDKGELIVGQCKYRLVVLPPHTETLNRATVDLLEKYLKSGGQLLCCGPAPTRVDGQAGERAGALAKLTGWKQVGADAAVSAALGAAGDGFRIERPGDDRGILFHQRRRLDDGELLFLVNTSADAPSAGTLSAEFQFVERWDPASGATTPYALSKNGKTVQAAFELPPCGSLLLWLSDRAVPADSAGRTDPRPIIATPVDAKSLKAVAPKGVTEIKRLEPNALTLDYLDVTAGGQSLKSTYVYRANQFAFKQNGMERNPWNSAVQFRDELIAKKFAPDSGVEATYRFTIEGEPPQPLWIVIERPDLYTVTCNGKPLKAGKEWWLDKAFGRLEISSAARSGENEVTISARPFSIYCELESAYLLGEFSLKPNDAGFVVAKAEPMKLGDWNKQGCPFYAAATSYSQQFEIAKPAGRYVVDVPDWHGSVAKVLVNGDLAGHLVSRPWQCDVTGLLRPGANKIDVVVVGTLKNLLGPHHQGSPRGTAWPAMFQKGPDSGPPPGEKYDTIGYGLREPFVLRNGE